jgi:hypothetical protein
VFPFCKPCRNFRKNGIAQPGLSNAFGYNGIYQSCCHPTTAAFVLVVNQQHGAASLNEFQRQGSSRQAAANNQKFCPHLKIVYFAANFSK